MLRCLGGNSTYLADLALREAAALRALCRAWPRQRGGRGDGPPARHPAANRAQARSPRCCARASASWRWPTAVADIGGIWKLEQVTEALTALAETALARAVAHLLRAAHDAGELRLPNPDDPETDGGFTVLGMGKLGARELNYSSDVDLVLLYDPAASIYTELHAPPRAIGALHDPVRAWPRFADGSARLRRLRVSHRSAPAPRSRRDAACRRRCRRPSPTTKAWVRTGSAPPW